MTKVEIKNALINLLVDSEYWAEYFEVLFNEGEGSDADFNTMNNYGAKAGVLWELSYKIFSAKELENIYQIRAGMEMKAIKAARNHIKEEKEEQAG